MIPGCSSRHAKVFLGKILKPSLLCGVFIRGRKHLHVDSVWVNDAFCTEWWLEGRWIRTRLFTIKWALLSRVWYFKYAAFLPTLSLLKVLLIRENYKMSAKLSDGILLVFIVSMQQQSFQGELRCDDWYSELLAELRQISFWQMLQCTSAQTKVGEI